MINLNHLHYFYVCAQFKSVTRAADSLGISQPSLSQQLKIFEAEVGARLFVRNGRVFELSPRGQFLYEKSKLIFDAATLLTKSFETQTKSSQTAQRPYRICVSDEIERPFVVEIIGRILKSKIAQNRAFQVISKTHGEIAENFATADFDLYITNMALGRRKPSHMFQFPVYLVTSKNQQQFKHFNEGNLRSLLHRLNEPLIAPTSGMVLRNEMDAALKALGLRPEIVFESNILACTVRAIREGIGCGFLPAAYIRNDFKLGLLSAVGPAKGYWQHKIFFYSNGRTEDSVLNALIRTTGEFV